MDAGAIRWARITSHCPPEANTPRISDNPSCLGDGQTAWKGTITVSTAVPMAADHSTVVCGASELLSLRVMISATAQQKALAIANRAAG
jgi:hypothetical protein